MPTSAPAGLRGVAALIPDSDTDGELLVRFLAHRDEAAFAALVRRHAAMVLGVCRRVLGNAADADDAFQAAFVVLVRKAHDLVERTNVGNLLYGIAFRTALKAKAMAAKRRTLEARAIAPEPRADQTELLAALDEELAKLPDKYREPVVLCELEGRSRHEIAKALGVAEGTLSSRLAAAHRILEKRLKSRGFAGAVLAMVFAGQRTVVAESVTETAVRAVVAPSATVSQLASEVAKMALLHKLGIAAAALVMVTGVGVVIAAALPDQPPAGDPPKAVALPVAPPPRAVAPEPAWKVEFRKSYGLKDGELVRRIAPPFAECRTEYFRDYLRRAYKTNDVEEDVARYKNYFARLMWKDGWVDGWPGTMYLGRDKSISLYWALNLTTGFNRARVEADPSVLETGVTGDWVVRVGAEPARLAAALETVLRKECGLKVTVAVKDAEREVFVLWGKYKSNPLPGKKEHHVEFIAHEVKNPAEGWGGPGTFEEMIECAEGWVEVPIELGKIEGMPKGVSWHATYRRAPFTVEENAEDRNPPAVVANIGTQTGLTVQTEKRTIKVLVVKKDP